MIEMDLDSNIEFSMVKEIYQNALREMVREFIDEIIEDAIGIAVWKAKKGRVCLPPAHIMEQESSPLIQDLS